MYHAMLSMFHGLIIYMYYHKDKKYQMPHIHVKYEYDEVVLSILEGEILEGEIPQSKINHVRTWITIHKDKLMDNWELVQNGKTLYKIEALE